MRLLIVEDDPVIADQVARGLRMLDHDVHIAMSGAGALLALQRGHWDAIVLDRMLPDLNGLSVIAQIRHDRHAVPILMLSALGSVKDRIEGLASGADDYLAKPFDMDELAARIAAISRRGTAVMDSTRLAVGRLHLDPSGHQACFRDHAVTLNRRQYSLLAHLMGHADQLVTRSMLLETVWGYAFTPTANIVESNLSRLRAALIGIDCDPIETRRSAGYILRSDRCA